MSSICALDLESCWSVRGFMLRSYRLIRRCRSLIRSHDQRYWYVFLNVDNVYNGQLKLTLALQTFKHTFWHHFMYYAYIFIYIERERENKIMRMRDHVGFLLNVKVEVIILTNYVLENEMQCFFSASTLSTYSVLMQMLLKADGWCYWMSNILRGCNIFFTGV